MVKKYSRRRVIKDEKRYWLNYHNEQEFHECQLLTMLNAYYFWTGKTVFRESKRFKKLIDKSGCRHGAPIYMEKFFPQFELTIEKTYSSINDFTKDFPPYDMMNPTIGPLPVEVSVHCDGQQHSVLIVNHAPIVKAIQVTNMKYTTSLGWIFIEQFIDLMHKVPALPWIARFISHKDDRLKRYNA